MLRSVADGADPFLEDPFAFKSPGLCVLFHIVGRVLREVHPSGLVDGLCVAVAVRYRTGNRSVSIRSEVAGGKV